MYVVFFCLGACCGDALGANTEFMSMKKIQQKFGYVRDMKHSTQRPLGGYTDDGESFLALATGIIECLENNIVGDDGSELLKEEIIIRHYTTAFMSEPRRGYGPTSSRILMALANKEITPERSGTMFFPTGSYSNGCLM
jgi:ADP-ribosylglycohydrolase